MDRFHEIEVLVAVADAGSFTKAGAHLRLSPQAVTRAISALEDRLGARVFNRTTRTVAITEVGQRFLANARRLLTDLETAEKEALGETATPQGRLTITASVTFGRSTLPPVVCDFLAQYPRVSGSVLLLDRIVNLVDEGVDVAVRIGHLPDSGLVAKRIGAVQRVLVASSEYLARRGTPSSPADLRAHSVIAFTGLMPNREWRFLNGQKPAGVSLDPAFEINDAAAAVEQHGGGTPPNPDLSTVYRADRPRNPAPFHIRSRRYTPGALMSRQQGALHRIRLFLDQSQQGCRRSTDTALPLFPLAVAG